MSDKSIFAAKVAEKFVNYLVDNKIDEVDRIPVLATLLSHDRIKNLQMFENHIDEGKLTDLDTYIEYYSLGISKDVYRYRVTRTLFDDVVNNIVYRNLINNRLESKSEEFNQITRFSANRFLITIDLIEELTNNGKINILHEGSLDDIEVLLAPYYERYKVHNLEDLKNISVKIMGDDYTFKKGDFKPLSGENPADFDYSLHMTFINDYYKEISEEPNKTIRVYKMIKLFHALTSSVCGYYKLDTTKKATLEDFSFGTNIDFGNRIEFDTFFTTYNTRLFDATYKIRKSAVVHVFSALKIDIEVDEIVLDRLLDIPGGDLFQRNMCKEIKINPCEISRNLYPRYLNKLYPTEM